MTRQELNKQYFEYGKLLEDLGINDFKNHCYWRMANDSAIGSKWDIGVERPFVKNASHRQMQRSCDNLRDMFNNPEKIEEYNRKSLRFRNKL